MNHLRSLFDALRRDLRYVLRTLRRSPLFTVAAVLTLAVGIGANAAIFSVVDNLLLRPLPYPDEERLSMVATTRLSDRGSSRQVFQTGHTWEVLRDHARTVDAAPFSNWAGGVNLYAGGRAAHVAQQRVGAGFFRVLGVAPVLGRGFTAAEDVPGGPRVAVLGHDLWQRTFGGDRRVLGREILLKGEPHTVVGVMPEGFRSTAAADLWTPLQPTTTGEGAGTNYGIVVRPRPGVTPAAAEEEVAALGQRPLNLPFRVVGGDGEDRAVSARYVTPGYFRTLRVPVLRGRDVDARDDAGAPPVAVVNRAFVERYLVPSSSSGGGGGVGDSLGARLALLEREVEVVGVVGDVLVDPSEAVKKSPPCCVRPRIAPRGVAAPPSSYGIACAPTPCIRPRGAPNATPWTSATGC